MAAIDIENKVETAWFTVLELNAYIVANSIPVRRYHDSTSSLNVSSAVFVNVNPAVREFPNSSLWTCDVELMAVTYLVDDKDQADLEALYKEVLGVAVNTTNTTLTAAGVITFNGKTQLDPNEKMFDEEGRFQTIITNIKCHVQT